MKFIDTKLVKRHNRPFKCNARKLELMLANSKNTWTFEAIQDELGVTAPTLYELCDYINHNSGTKYVLPQPKPTVRPATVTPLGSLNLSGALIESLGLSGIFVPGMHPMCKPYGKGVLILPEEETSGDVPATAESVQSFDDEKQCDNNSASQDAEIASKELAPFESPQAVAVLPERADEAEVILTSTRPPKEAPIATGADDATSKTGPSLAEALQAFTAALSRFAS